MAGNHGAHRAGDKRGRTKRREFRDGRPNVWKRPRAEGEAGPGGGRGWQPFVTESQAYEKYYKKQGVVPKEEWDLFIETLRKPLPTCFRINGGGQFAQDIRAQMQHDFFDYLKEGVEVDGEMLEPIKPLEWYPGQLAWTLRFSRNQLRKIPILKRIHEFLKQENEIGSITRQEAVSMLPPLFLKVEPHHRVLDTPGSKTFQLLEMIHKDDKPGLLPDGLVIANDLDVQRCHLLIHQTKRMCSPNILVTNHEAQHFPGLRKKGKEYTTQHDSDDGKTSDALGETKTGDGAVEEVGLLFDRVLCDVPCSGDGTIRKAPDIWKKWHCGLGNGIHRLQIQIAMRGVALLKVGGRLVYSTCSLNPVEDEAVVGEMLRQAGGSLELLDVSSEMPGLKYRQGLKSWLVRDKRRWLCSASEADRHRAGAIVPSMFPSGKGWDQSGELGSMDFITEAACGEVGGDNVHNGKEEDAIEDVEEEVAAELEVSSLPLERCMRILPHDQNSGGFFIAVFQKVAQFRMHPKLKERTKNEKRRRDQSKDLAGKLDEPGDSPQDPAVIVDSTSSDAVNDTEMTDQTPPVALSDSTPVGPSEEDTICAAKEVEASEQHGGNTVQIIESTVDEAERQAAKETVGPCAFRIASEGLPVMLPHMTKHIVHTIRADFKLLLSGDAVPFHAFNEPEFVKALQSLVLGCCVILLPERNAEGEVDLTLSTAVGCWRGRNNVSLLITRAETAQMLQRLSLGDEERKASEKSTHVVEPTTEGVKEVKEEMTDVDQGTGEEPRGWAEPNPPKEEYV